MIKENYLNQVSKAILIKKKKKAIDSRVKFSKASPNSLKMKNLGKFRSSYKCKVLENT